MLTYYEIMAGIHLAAWLYCLSRARLAPRAANGAASDDRVPHYCGGGAGVALRLATYGFGLNALSYLFHAVDYVQHWPLNPLTFITGFAGTVMLFYGWSEYVRLLARRRATVSAPHPEPPTAIDFDGFQALFDPLAAATLDYACEEAGKQGTAEVDTEHLLLGLLRLPGSRSTNILMTLGVRPVDIADMVTPVAIGARSTVVMERSACGLTSKAKEAIRLATLEANRFGKNAVGTEHLLLGLALKGNGAAAHALYRQGVTADLVRSTIHDSRIR